MFFQCKVSGTVAHVDVWYEIAHTGVLFEDNLVALWGVYFPVRVCITCHAEAISFKLGDREKVRNSALIQPHVKDAQLAL